MPSPQIQAYSAKYLPFIQQELREFFAEKKLLAKKTSQYALQSVGHLEDFTFYGGKFMRSLLVVAGFRLAGGTDEGVYRVAAAVELFHKYMLNMDDMADRDELRYGAPTLWRRYQTEFEHAGWGDAAHHARTFSEIDGMLLSSFITELVRTANFPAEKLLKTLEIIDNGMYWPTIGGWQIHYAQNQQTLLEASEIEYLKGLEMVTAEYSFVAPLQIGVTLAGGNLEILDEYGRAVGQAFQIQDDILGMFGKTAETGKPVGNDFRESKKTLLIQRAYHSSKISAAEKKFLEKVCGQKISASDLERAQSIIEKSGALPAAQNHAKKLIKQAHGALVNLPHLTEIDLLHEIADFVVDRKA